MSNLKKRRKDCKYTDSFSQIDTEEKAYFLGLLYSDGCIGTVKDRGNDRRYVRISLSIDEKYILEKLKEKFPYFSLRTFDFSKYNKNRKIQASLSYKGEWIYQDLKKHGLLERKSYENKDLMVIPKTIPSNLLHHFIRGYFDGDGSIYIKKDRPNLRRIEIGSVSKTIIEDLFDWFKINNTTPSWRIKTPSSSKQTMFVIEWRKNEDILKFKDLIYNNATIYFLRKKEKFDTFKIVDLTDKGINCPYCNFNKTTLTGKRETSKGIGTRLICKSCNKRFTKYLSPQ